MQLRFEMIVSIGVYFILPDKLSAIRSANWIKQFKCNTLDIHVSWEPPTGSKLEPAYRVTLHCGNRAILCCYTIILMHSFVPMAKVYTF